MPDKWWTPGNTTLEQVGSLFKAVDAETGAHAFGADPDTAFAQLALIKSGQAPADDEAARMEAIGRAVVAYIATPGTEDLGSKYATVEEVISYLDAMRGDDPSSGSGFAI